MPSQKIRHRPKLALTVKPRHDNRTPGNFVTRIPPGTQVRLMLYIDANLFAFLAEEVVDLVHNARGDDAEIGVNCRRRPYGALGKDWRLDGAPAHLGFDGLAALERDGGLDREFQVVCGALFRVLAVELAGDIVLFQLDGCGWLESGLLNRLAVELDSRGALGVSPWPGKPVAEKTSLDLGR